MDRKVKKKPYVDKPLRADIMVIHGKTRHPLSEAHKCPICQFKLES